MRATCSLALGLLFSGTALGQQCDDPTRVVEGGRFELRVNGTGLAFDSSQVSLYYTDARGARSALVYIQGVWVTARDQEGEILVAAQNFQGLAGDEQGDFYPGPLSRTRGQRDTSGRFCTPAAVTAAEIAAHLADLADGHLNDPLPAIMQWPGRGNPGIDFSFDTGPLAPFVDEDGDGRYDPTRGDYPAIIGDYAVWWVMNDEDVHEESRSDPLGVEVQGLLQGFTNADDDLNGVLKLTYTVTNSVGRALDSVAVALWQDGDIGCWADDALGTLPELDAIYLYNVDEVDGFANSGCDEETTLENELPALVTQLLDVRLDGGATPFRTGAIAVSGPVTGTSVPFGIRDPTPGRAKEYDRLTRGRWRNGEPLRASGNGYQTDGPITDWIYPGNPAEDGSWSACQGAGGDFRALLSARPDAPLADGQTLTLDYIIAALDDVEVPCPDNGPIAAALERVTALVQGRPLVSSAPAPPAGAGLAVYPNPSGPAGFTIALPSALAPSRLTVADGAGRLVREVTATVPEHHIVGLPTGFYVVTAHLPDGSRRAQRVLID